MFLFVREALPGARWAWLVAGLAVAPTPLLGFMSGGVTPEAMLYTVSAAAFFCLARAFRLGLTPKRGAIIGAVIAIGLLTKLNFLGFVPGMVLAFAVLVKRQRTLAPTAAYRAAGIAVATWLHLRRWRYSSGALSHAQLDLPATTGQSITQHGSLLGNSRITFGNSSFPAARDAQRLSRDLHPRARFGSTDLSDCTAGSTRPFQTGSTMSR